MLRNNTPLTEEQSAFADKHHDKIVYGFLARRGLSRDTFYDVVIFGYLRAVRDYLTRDDLRERFKFSTIAYKDMLCSYTNYCAAQKRACRSAQVQRYNEGVTEGGRLPMRELEEAVTARENTGRLVKHLTPQQGKIIYLRAEGYSLTGIGRKCGLPRKEVQSHLESARDNIVRFAPDLAGAA